MSGDVQPRKRKDKKKKKDDLGVEEPRGTAAAFGEGDVFMHSPSEHGTGGHWCAKVIFFSLLAVLITLIGLIILENRGLTELEANSVESRYSGVLEGWIEDSPDDDHHDEHTLELKHHVEDEGHHGSELENDDDDEHDNDDQDDVNESDEHDDDDEDDDDDSGHDHENDEEREQDADDSEEANNADEDDDDDINENQGSDEQYLDTAEEGEDDVEESSYRKFYENNEKLNENDDVDDDSQKEESYDQKSAEDRQDEDNEESNDDDDDHNQLDDDDDDDDEKQNNDSLEDKEYEDSPFDKNDDDDDDDDNSNEADDYLQNDAANEDKEEHEEEEAANIEIETIEREISDEDAASTEEPAAKDDDGDISQEISEELSPEDDHSVEDDDVEFLEPDELDELPIVEPITAPKGKPLPEVEETSSTEKPQDTLADEEEYERQQEELRKEREQASQSMWLKLTVGGALLVATHAVLRRATASRETEDEPDYREETPLSDRRMTLLTEPVPPPTVSPKLPELSRPKESEVKKEATNVSFSPTTKEELEDEEEILRKPIQSVQNPEDTVDRELYSDEEEAEEEESTLPNPQQAVPQTPQIIPDVTKEVTPEPDEDDDVEIIDEEQLEEEIEEEEISDVDDAELLSRLEEKYGRLPEPERPGRTHKDGGNSIEEDWPGEPADAFWSEHLEQAQRELRQGNWMAAVDTASSSGLATSARARYIAARALDAAADAKKDNQLLNKAIAAYLELLKMNERLSNKKLLEVATRTLDRIKFRGNYLSAEPVYKLLIRRFPDDPTYRNNLTISLLMANRADLAENVLKETLKHWPDDRVALAHHGFILKTLHNRLEEAVEAFTKALEGDTGAANEPRFYYHLGDALLLLGRFDEAHEVHKRGTLLGHFLSPNQRSLYNVDRLKSKPWWNVNQTPYSRLAHALEKSWKEILKEGEAARAIYEKEKEGLKERGEWSQLDLFVRGREVPNRCSRAPVTCGIVKSELAASGCRRGQIKFSMMEAGTHVRRHVGPTNCRLRMHLGLSNTKDTFIRVDRETRQWQTGKVLMFDDSFEHEVWHNGTGTRLVLIVDVWHPDLTPAERRQLPAI